MMRKALFSGDGSTLSLDFTTGVLDSRLTFTRSTTGTYINSSGYVTSAAINAPRFDYDPTTLTARGLLIEGSATNLLSRSEEFNLVGPWFQFNATITANDGTAPDGNTTADSIQATTSGAGGVFRSNEIPSGTHTFSIFAKANGANSFSVSIDTSGNGRGVDFTLTSGGSAGTPYVRGTGGTVSSLTASVQAFQSGWVRCIVIAVTTGTNSVAIYTQSGTSKWLAWGAQLEAGSVASSYIPTVASQGTRAADVCYMSGISSWFNESAGTVISNVTYNGLASDNSGIELSVGTTTSSTNRIGIRKGYVDYYSGGTLSAEMYPTVTSGNVRIGTAYSLNDFAMCSNGGTMRTDASGAVPVGLNTLKLYADNGTSALVLNGLIKSIKYFPTRLSNAQLQALTT